MARNKYPGYCYACGCRVESGYGHFERYNGHWRIKCVKCASGRVLSESDSGVVWAKKAYAESKKRSDEDAIHD